MVMHLQGGTRAHFMNLLAREYQDLVQRYESLYAGKYARKDYTKRADEVVSLMRALPAEGTQTPAAYHRRLMLEEQHNPDAAADAHGVCFRIRFEPEPTRPGVVDTNLSKNAHPFADGRRGAKEPT